MSNTMTYSSMGTNGRFGNQMFQYAALLSAANKKGVEFFIPDTTPSGETYEILNAFPNVRNRAVSIEDMRKINHSQAGQYREPGFSYDQNFDLLIPNIDLHGYFQSEMYFSKDRETLLKDFQFEEPIQGFAKLEISRIKESANVGNICAIHVRRGDYLGLPDYHTNLDNDYYNAAIRHMLENFGTVGFLIFSDDIGWCRSAFPSDPRIVFSDGRSQYEDMCMMSMCDLHIIANSSFSWWGSWLSESLCTIAPRQWFGPKGPSNWNTIYRQGWLLA